jgi:hypothetical protein
LVLTVSEVVFPCLPALARLVAMCPWLVAAVLTALVAQCPSLVARVSTVEARSLLTVELELLVVM